MRKILIVALASTALVGCASKPPQWLLGSDSCPSIGCGKDLEFYPMAPGEANRQAKAAGWDWGTTSSAQKPGTPEFERLRRLETEAGNTPWHWNQPK
jgi:hypothetical protein